MTYQIIQNDILKWAASYTGPKYMAVLYSFTSALILPFSVHMATMAQRNKVLQSVGFFRRGKITKAASMVHVQLFPIFQLRFRAILTSVLVALAGLVALPYPIWSVVAIIATAPSRIPASRKTNSRTLNRAKTALMLYPNLISRLADKNLTNFTGPLYPMNPIWSLFSLIGMWACWSFSVRGLRIFDYTQASSLIQAGL